MDKKILIAAPTYDGMRYCHDDFFAALSKLKDKGDFLIVDNSDQEEYFEVLRGIDWIKAVRDKDNAGKKGRFKVISSRNKILDYALHAEYDYVLMLDSDVIVPEDIVEELLACDKDIVSGVYYNYFNVKGKTKYLPVCWKYFTQEEFDKIKERYGLPEIVKTRKDLRRHMTEQEVASGRLQEVFLPSAGCMLMSRKVFERTRYGELKKEGVKTESGDDIYFVLEAEKNDFKCYCNPSVRCDHLVLDKYEKDDEGNFVHKSFS